MYKLNPDNYADYVEMTQRESTAMAAKLENCLSVIQYLMNPKSAFGRRAGASENSKAAQMAIADFEATYQKIASAEPYKLGSLPELVEISPAKPEITRFSYRYVLTTPKGKCELVVQAPFRFVLQPAGFSLQDLHKLVANKAPKEELRSCVMHYASLNFLLAKNKSLLALFEDLRLPISSEVMEGLGPLPITVVNSSVPTMRPPDPLLAQICRLTGLKSAQEVIDLEKLTGIVNPLAQRLREESDAWGAEVQIPA